MTVLQAVNTGSNPVGSTKIIAGCRVAVARAHNPRAKDMRRSARSQFYLLTEINMNRRSNMS